MGVGRKIAKWTTVIGALDDLMGASFNGIMGVAVGGGKGLINKKLTNIPKNLNGLGQLIGYGTTKSAVGLTKPIVASSMVLAKNSGKDLIHAGRIAKNTTTTMRDVFLKRAKEGSEHAFLGYESRALTGHALVAGAALYGMGNSAKKYDYNMAVKSAVNGPMDNMRVAVAPGSVNPSYTPVKDFGATGDMVFAMHNKRHG